MLDMKFVKENPEKVVQAMKNRNMDKNLDDFLVLEKQRREILQEVEADKSQRNLVSEEISKMKKAGENADVQIKAMRTLGEKIASYDKLLKDIEANLKEILFTIPNMPADDVPSGKSENDNIVIRTVGEPKHFAFQPQAHWDIGEKLDILDFERASKVTGARFAFYKGLGSRLERSVYNFMLDVHTSQHGDTEIFPPYIVNKESMIGTGQLPKFAEDMFKLEGLDYYLIPTAEVPVTNYHRGEILNLEDLPIKYSAYSACFRAEAGSAGRDTRGLIRQHQFNKVELVKFTKPEDSWIELDKLVNDAEEILQLLKLPYHVVRLCTGDIGFSSATTYDLEVWIPAANCYREISSCSNFLDFQARRADIKFRRGPKEKPEYVHTLNGSGLAVGRTVCAILENYQNEDGSVTIPDVLVPYMGCTEIKNK